MFPNSLIWRLTAQPHYWRYAADG